MQVGSGFSAAGAMNLAVFATGVQRGNIKTGDGCNDVPWVVHSSLTAGPNNTTTSLTCGGDDHIGTGDDTVTLLAGSSVVNGGVGTESAMFDGPASRCTVAALADGSTRVVDGTGVLQLTALWRVERLHFADAEIAALGQAALASVPDLSPVG